MSKPTIVERVRGFAIPLAVIAALYTLSTVELSVPHREMDEPEIELRDRFLGVASDGTVVWAVGKDGKIVRSEDSGKTFAVQNSPVQVNFQDIVMWDPQTAVVVGNRGTVLTTSDGGATWDHQALDVPIDGSGKLFRARLGPDGRVWTVSELNYIAVSADKGKTWQRVTREDTDHAWNDIAFAGSRICVAGEFGKVACSDDQGATWAEKSTGQDVSLMGLAFRDDLHGVAVGLNGLIVSTEDAGESWNHHPVEGLSRHIFDVAWGGSRWLAVGDKGLLLFADGSASNWQVTRLTETDFAWHTAIEVLSADAFMASGQTLGVYRDGTWQAFGHLMPGG